jgi:hypothetical protein
MLQVSKFKAILDLDLFVPRNILKNYGQFNIRHPINSINSIGKGLNVDVLYLSSF